MPRRSSKNNSEKDKGVFSRIADAMSGQSTSDEASDEAPKATDLLKQQHDEVRRLFKEYEHSSEGAHAARKRLIDEASRGLEVHAELEERIFYPACKALNDEKAQKMVGESFEEHLIVKRLIKELQGLGGADEKFEAKAVVLKESVQHHADEEESDLFPAAEKELGDERLRALGKQMSLLKERLSAKNKSPRTASPSGRRSSGRHAART